VDPASAAIPNLPITLKTMRRRRSEDRIELSRFFRFPNLQAGTYSLRIQASGFKAYTSRTSCPLQRTRDVGQIGLHWAASPSPFP